MRREGDHRVDDWSGGDRCWQAGVRNFALLFVVGEERNSAGSHAAAEVARGSRLPDQWRADGEQVGAGSKGTLRYEIDGAREAGAFGLSGTGALGNSLAARCACGNSRDGTADGQSAGTFHAECGVDFRRARAERDCGRGAAEIMFRLVGDPATFACGRWRELRGTSGSSAGSVVYAGDTSVVAARNLRRPWWPIPRTFRRLMARGESRF